METRCTLETKCGFLSWQSDDGVLNFLSGCSPHGIRLIVHGLLSRRRTTSPMPKSLFGTDGIRGVPGTPPLDDSTLFATGHALGGYLHRAHSAPSVPPRRCLSAWTRANRPRTLRRSWPPASRKLAHRWPSRE